MMSGDETKPTYASTAARWALQKKGTTTDGAGATPGVRSDGAERVDDARRRNEADVREHGIVLGAPKEGHVHERRGIGAWLPKHLSRNVLARAFGDDPVLDAPLAADSCDVAGGLNVRRARS